MTAALKGRNNYPPISEFRGLDELRTLRELGRKNEDPFAVYKLITGPFYNGKESYEASHLIKTHKISESTANQNSRENSFENCLDSVKKVFFDFFNFIKDIFTLKVLLLSGVFSSCTFIILKQFCGFSILTSILMSSALAIAAISASRQIG